MRFFSKLIFICNICFILSVVLRYVEVNNDAAGNNADVIGFQPLQSSLIVLGYGAVIFNFIFLLSSLVFFIFKKTLPFPAWILLFNLILFVTQLVYFLY